ncbi:MAG: hypothetical protein Q7V88_05870 [Actinomycetota bacterium]|nr:hypothetical protein [Actinomycetota bacterium]
MSQQVTAATPFVPDDDTYHLPTVDDPLWFETTWWSFSVPERRLGGWLHAGRHTNRGTVSWRVFVWDPSGADPGRLAYYRNMPDVPLADDADLRAVEFPAGGFSVRMLTPLMDYHVAYADPEARFAVEFEHRSVHPPHRFTPGEAPAMHNPHLDQLGHLTGEMMLDGERIAIDCYSVRDRTWGPRSRHHSHGAQPAATGTGSRILHPGGAGWRQIERERGRGRIQYIFGHSWGGAGCDTGFLSFVRPQDGDAAGWSPLNMGWLLKDAEFARLDKSRSRMKNYRNPDTGWSEHMEVLLVDERGRTMEAEGVALSHMCEHAAGSNASMRWEFDGKVGWGEDQDGWRVDHFARMRRALRSWG